MAALLAFLAAVVVFCGWMLVDQVMAEKRRKAFVRSRIAPDGSMQPLEDAPIGLTGEPSPTAQRLLGLLAVLGVDVEKAKTKLERRFAQAGILSPDAPAFYLFYQRAGALFFLVLALICLATMTDQNRLLMLLLALFLMIVGLFGAQLYLQNCIDKRKKLLQRAFPDTLDLLLVCVESGLSLDASLTRVCSELGRAYPEMTAELNRTRLELGLINDRPRALANLGERTDMVAFRSLISALIQSERFGTSLTDTLRVLSEDFRLLRLSDAEAKAARLPVLITIPLVLLLMPALLIVVLGPAIVKFNNQGKQVIERKQ